ncbi:hypothetical protein BMS3Abin17_01294 [archaeon BMS3Abin17]|nr:hypothetical protein BMS3Abin17_01294 [archaeon BMS3Abin17]
MDIWSVLVSLNYALIDVIFIEVIIFTLFKINDRNAIKIGSNKGKFKESEWFVFGFMIVSIIFFYLSNLLQNWAILQLTSLKWWLLLILLGLSLLSTLFLAKCMLGRKWRFRLVLYPLILLIITILTAVLIAIFR